MPPPPPSTASELGKTPIEPGALPEPAPDAPLVLVADDDEDTRFLYMAELALMGYRTAGESDGARVVEAALRIHPDALLMDVSMPVLDGIEATRRIKKDARTSGCLVILMTGYGMTKFEEARDAGCDAFFCKPFDPAALHQVLGTLSSPPRQPDESPNVVKQCTCGRQFSLKQWLALPPCGRLHVPLRGVVVELRNCTCGSSLAVELDDLGHAVVRATVLAESPRERGAAKDIVLVVDRDPHIRRLVQQFLGDAGVVEFADDGYSALERVRTSAPTAVITEILIPRLDGLALCRLLKGDPATQQVPIVVISMLAAKERARQAGADAFLEKPLERTSLVASLRGLIQSKGPSSTLPPQEKRTS